MARRPHPSRRRPLTALVVASLALAVSCGDGGGGDAAGDEPPAGTASAPAPETTADEPPAGTASGPAPEMTADELAAASGGAPAATGAGLAEPPGPSERWAVAGEAEVAASVTAADGRVTACCLLVAAAPEQRQRGLMEVEDLGGYDGMVFVWDQDTAGGFWMRNTVLPLSIAWFDAEGAFVSATDMAPCPDDEPDCPIYEPAGPYRFALEVPQGRLDELGVGPGSRLALGGPCG
ncbi:MAG: DUF192 domain-containing protein [Thermoanaerobacterales bacterium]|nr:DUF192 domain-containing protein [Thermoanaerobacterales bacterium]